MNKNDKYLKIYEDDFENKIQFKLRRENREQTDDAYFNSVIQSKAVQQPRIQ